MKGIREASGDDSAAIAALLTELGYPTSAGAVPARPAASARGSRPRSALTRSAETSAGPSPADPRMQPANAHFVRPTPALRGLGLGEEVWSLRNLGMCGHKMTGWVPERRPMRL